MRWKRRGRKAISSSDTQCKILSQQQDNTTETQDLSRKKDFLNPKLLPTHQELDLADDLGKEVVTGKLLCWGPGNTFPSGLEHRELEEGGGRGVRCAPLPHPPARSSGEGGMQTPRKPWGTLCPAESPGPHPWPGRGATFLLVCRSRSVTLGTEGSS